MSIKLKIIHGFTLGEVLITLGIIGIVAAMTLPGIIERYKKYEYSTRIKKFNTAFSQAILQIEAENDSALQWERDDTSFIRNMLLPKLKYAKAIQDYGTFKIFFLDGSMAGLATGACLDVIYDCNGEKGPNTYGADRFDFLMCFTDATRRQFFGNKNKFFGPQRHYTSREAALQGCKTNSINCAGLLEQDGWEFKDDYPYTLK